MRLDTCEALNYQWFCSLAFSQWWLRFALLYGCTGS